MFLDGPDANARDAVHVVFAGKKVREEYTEVVRNHFDATTLTDAQVDKAIAKSIRRHSGATGNASREIAATGDLVESMLNMITTWLRNVHAANPNLAALPAEVKGTGRPYDFRIPDYRIVGEM